MGIQGNTIECVGLIKSGGVGEQQITPFRDSVSSFGENVDASLSNSVVAKDKQTALVQLVIQYYFSSTIFLVLMYSPACI